MSFIQRALHSFVFTISFSVIGNSHRKIHLGNFYLENRQRKINFLTQSKLVCQLEGSGEVKSPDSYTRFLLRLKCTLRCWSHGYFPSGQSCSCISLWKGPPLQRRSQEPVFWSFCSKAGPAWEWRGLTRAGLHLPRRAWQGCEAGYVRSLAALRFFMPHELRSHRAGVPCSWRGPHYSVCFVF